MSSLDFPNNPSDGDKHPDPAQPGVGQWTYDASKGIWTGEVDGSSITPGLDDVLNVSNVGYTNIIIRENSQTAELGTQINHDLIVTPSYRLREAGNDTGMFSGGDNIISFKTSNVDKLKVTSNKVEVLTALEVATGNNFVANGLTYPSTDGTNGQVITTDGSGNLSFTTVSGGGVGGDVPAGGTTGQILSKINNIDYNTQWVDRPSDGRDGQDGAPGQDGADGVGVPAGGTAGQILSKINGNNYNTQWIDPPSGGSTPSTPSLQAVCNVGNSTDGRIDALQFRALEGNFQVLDSNNNIKISLPNTGKIDASKIELFDVGSDAEPAVAWGTNDDVSYGLWATSAGNVGKIGREGVPYLEMAGNYTLKSGVIDRSETAAGQPVRIYQQALYKQSLRRSIMETIEDYDISEVDLDNILQSIPPRLYRGVGSTESVIGLIAEDVAEVFPNLCTYDYHTEFDEETNQFIECGDLEPIDVRFDSITVLLVMAYKRQRTTITDLRNELDSLKARVEALEQT